MEVAIRVFHAFHPVYIFSPASPSRFRGQPFAQDYDFRLNSRGFKDVEFTAKRPGVLRIVALGDSVAYGVVPYRFNFLTLLEDQLNGQGRPLEVFNMGVPAAGPAEYLSLFVTEGLDLAPDFVLVTFFIGNDLTDNYRRKTRPLSSYSYVVTLLRFVVRARHVKENLWAGHGARVYDDTAPTFSDDMFMSMETARSRIYRKDFDELGAMVARAFEPLSELKRICDGRSIPLVVVLVPDEVQVDPALQRRVLATMGWRHHELDFARPNAMLAAPLERHRIDFLDLLDVFTASARATRLYKPNDTHWNIAGNRLAAEAIAAHLRDRVR